MGGQGKPAPSAWSGMVRTAARLRRAWQVRRIISLGVACRRAAAAPPEGLGNLLEALGLDAMTSAKMRIQVRRAMRKTRTVLSAGFAIIVSGLVGWLVWADRPPVPGITPRYAPSPNAYWHLEGALQHRRMVEQLHAMTADPTQREEIDLSTPMTRMALRPGTATALPVGAPPSVADMQQVLDANQAAMATVARTKGVPCQAPLLRTYLLRANARPGLVCDLALLQQLRARVRMAHQDWQGAMAASLEAVRIGRMVRHGAGTAGVLVGANCERIGRRTAWRCVEHLTAPEALAAASTVAALRADQVPLATAIEADMEEGLACMRSALGTPNWRMHIRSLWIPAQQPNRDYDIAMALLTIRDTKRGLLADYEEWMRYQAALAGESYLMVSRDTELGTGYQRKRKLMGFIGNMIQDSYVPVAERYYLTEADDALLQVALMVRWYEATHGRAPNTLAEIGQRQLTIIRDPFGGADQTLKYLLVQGKPVLYSVGPDGMDGGGFAVQADQWARLSNWTTEYGDLRAGLGPDGFVLPNRAGKDQQDL